VTVGDVSCAIRRKGGGNEGTSRTHLGTVWGTDYILINQGGELKSGGLKGGGVSE